MSYISGIFKQVYADNSSPVQGQSVQNMAPHKRSWRTAATLRSWVARSGGGRNLWLQKHETETICTKVDVPREFPAEHFQKFRGFQNG